MTYDELKGAGVIPEHAADVMIDDLGGVALVGVLVYDQDCPNPLEDCDGMGKIGMFDQRRRSYRDPGPEDLGLEAPGKPDCSSGIIRRAERRLRDVLEDKAPDALMSWIIRETLDGRTREEAIDDFVALFKEGDLKEIGLNGREGIPDWEDLLLEAWEWFREAGAVGDAYAVPLGLTRVFWGEKFCVCADPLEADAAWVPDKELRKDLERIRAEKGLAAAREAAMRFAGEAVGVYNEWASGECYGARVLAVEKRGGDMKVIDEDALWGILGLESARDEMSRMMAHFRSRLALSKAA